MNNAQEVITVFAKKYNINKRAKEIILLKI